MPYDQTRLLLVGLAGEVVLLLIGFLLLLRFHQQRKRGLVQAERDLEQAYGEIEAKRKEALLEAKEEAHRLRKEIERENRERRQELQRMERRLTQRDESL